MEQFLFAFRTTFVADSTGKPIQFSFELQKVWERERERNLSVNVGKA